MPQLEREDNIIISYLSKPINHCTDVPERQKGNGRFFVARGQAPILLKTAKKAFDFVAVAVGLRVHRGRFEAIGTAGDNGFNTILSAVGAVFIAVVGRIGQHFTQL